MPKIEIVLKFAWNEFIYGGHLLSLGASAIALSTMILLNIKTGWEFLLIVYLGTQTIYNHNHYKELDRDILTNSERANHLKRYFKFLPLIVAFYGIGFLGLLICFGNLESIIFGIFLLFSGILFTKEFKGLTKKIIGFKTFYTALSWSLLIIFTAIYLSSSFNLLILIFFIFVFLRLIVNTISFDIKDIKSDQEENLLTFPIIFGREKFLNYVHIVNFISFTPLVIGVFWQILPLFSLSLIPLFFYSFYYIKKMRNKKVNIQVLSYIMIDGEYVFWPLLLFLGKMFMGL